MHWHPQSHVVPRQNCYFHYKPPEETWPSEAPLKANGMFIPMVGPPTAFEARSSRGISVGSASLVPKGWNNRNNTKNDTKIATFFHFRLSKAFLGPYMESTCFTESHDAVGMLKFKGCVKPKLSHAHLTTCALYKSHPPMLWM